MSSSSCVHHQNVEASFSPNSRKHPWILETPTPWTSAMLSITVGEEGYWQDYGAHRQDCVGEEHS